MSLPELPKKNEVVKNILRKDTHVKKGEGEAAEKYIYIKKEWRSKVKIEHTYVNA